MSFLPKAPAARRSAPFFRLANARALPGYVHGLRAPSLSAAFALHDPLGAQRAVLNASAALAAAGAPPERCRACSSASPPGDAHRAMTELGRVLQWLGALAGGPDVGNPFLLPLPPRSGAPTEQRWLVEVPSLLARGLAALLPEIVAWLNELGTAHAAERDLADAKEPLRFVAELGRHMPGGSNNRHFVAAAHALGIPWRVLPGNLIQYGWGSRARWLDSTFTDETAAIAANLAQHKFSAAALLRAARLPVPRERLAANEEAALRAAETLGYPVVVKPPDQDGGRGVAAGLRSAAELRAAFARAARYSPSVLVQKHVDGRDYRIIVFRGRALSAIERVPAGVTGDGCGTVRELVLAANRDPRRGAQRWSQMSPIVLDDEAEELLAAAGLALDAVPAPGRFVRLRRVANVSRGGTPVAVFDEMHPDNARLAERAAEVLRLDLAGVDLLLPDISRSWLETGGVICEVNAQPQLSVTAPRIHAELLGELVQGQGRVPVALVVTHGRREGAAVARQVSAMLGRHGLRTGVTSAEGLAIGAERQRTGRPSAFRDVQALLLNPGVDAVVAVAAPEDFIATGLPVDRLDTLVLMGPWRARARRCGRDCRLSLGPLLRLVRPHLGGVVIADGKDPAAAVAARFLGRDRLRPVSAMEDLPARLAVALLECAEAQLGEVSAKRNYLQSRHRHGSHVDSRSRAH